MQILRPLACAALVPAALAAGCGSGEVDPPRAEKLARPQQPRAFDPTKPLTDCLRAEGIPVRPLRSGEFGVGPPPLGMRVVFSRTPGAAQLAQLRGEAEGAIVAHRVLFYVGTASDAQISPVESCVNQHAAD